MRLLGALVREARPSQWTKNLLVFAAPAALGVLNQPRPLLRAILVFTSFCAVSSGAYYWNDLRDVEQDRQHPVKSRRPIAAGEIPLGIGAAVGASLLIIGPLLAMLARPQTGLVVLTYAVVTVCYSLWWKHVPLLDLAIVASGFVLRAVAGAVGTSTDMSSWFILCTTFGSFFIVAGKRFAELRELGVSAVSTRPILRHYSEEYLRQLLLVSCTATLVAYCLWASENAEKVEALLPLHILSIVPMALALLRYLMVLHEGGGGAPEEVFLRDRSLQVYGFAWLVIYGVAVYTG